MTDTTTDETETVEERSITVSRVIKASPERVYDAFLDPDDLAAWLPPTGFSAEVHTFEPKVGGTFRITFTGETEELAEYGHSFGGTYLELVPEKRIVYTDEFETDGPGMAGEMRNTITFEAVPNGTEVTVRQEEIPEAIPPEDAMAGWTDSLGKLAHLVEEA